jgi:hypothetical protein
MLEIPVEFEHEGKEYNGTLESVFGAGASDVYDLMINKYYFGRLRKYQDQWVFDPAKEEWLKSYAEYFGNMIAGWNNTQNSEL